MSVTQRDEFGRGITVPLEQDGQGDFRSTSGLDLLKNDVMSLLAIQGPIGKTPGEVPWDTDMGGNLDALRHRGMHNEVVEALAYEASAGVLEKYEPRARITDIKISDGADPSEKKIKVFFVPIGQGNARTESIELPLKE
jgi:phage baseplate assembly protein W